MKSQENKIQHFVPKCYLRNFSPNNESIYIYDKIEKKDFRNSVDKVAYSDYFYDLPEKYIENITEIPYGKRYYEREFFANNIERQYNRILKKVILCGESWFANRKTEEILTPEEKELFAQLIAIQYLRLPDIREIYSDATKKHTDAQTDIIKSFLRNEKPELAKEIDKIQVEYNEEFNPVLHSEIYSDEELYNGIANQILNKHWVYFISDSNDFYTSDNPIIIKPHIKNQRYFYEGFGMRGVEVIFPISSSILLTMWDTNYFENIEYAVDSFNTITDKQKREYNSYQYMLSNRQTYSFCNDFSLVKLLIICNNGNEFFREKSRILVNGK